MAPCALVLLSRAVAWAPAAGLGGRCHARRRVHRCGHCAVLSSAILPAVCAMCCTDGATCCWQVLQTAHAGFAGRPPGARWPPLPCCSTTWPMRQPLQRFQRAQCHPFLTRPVCSSLAGARDSGVPKERAAPRHALAPERRDSDEPLLVRRRLRRAAQGRPVRPGRGAEVRTG